MICLLWDICGDVCGDVNLSWLDRSVVDNLDRSWLRLLADAATRLLQSSGYEGASCKRLLGLGQRRSTILGRFEKPIPIFGLTDATFVSILRQDARVSWLRNIAHKCSNETDVLIIKSRVLKKGEDGRDRETFELATVPARSSKIASQAHYHGKRWVGIARDYRSPKFHVTKQTTNEILRVTDGEEYYAVDQDSIHPTQAGLVFRWANPPAMVTTTSFPIDAAGPKQQPKNSGDKHRRWNLFPRDVVAEATPSTPVATFEFVSGDVDTAALYRRVHLDGASFRLLHKKEEVPQENAVTLKEIISALKSAIVDPFRLALHMITSSQPRGEDRSVFEAHCAVTEALQAIATAAMVYSFLPSATVALNIVTYGSLSNSKWFERSDPRRDMRRDFEWADPDYNHMMPHCLSLDRLPLHVSPCSNQVALT